MGTLIEDYETDRLKIIQELSDCQLTCDRLEKLIELNMNDFWDVVDQRDWYYYECQRLKSQSQNKNANT
jgi:hypothetical protein